MNTNTTTMKPENMKEILRAIAVESGIGVGFALFCASMPGNYLATLSMKAAALGVLAASGWAATQWMKKGKLECLRRLVDDRVEDRHKRAGK